MFFTFAQENKNYCAYCVSKKILALGSWLLILDSKKYDFQRFCKIIKTSAGGKTG